MSRLLKFHVHPENEAHDGVSEEGRCKGCCGMQGHGIREEVHTEAQQESDPDQDGPVLLDRVPEKKQDIDHGVDRIQYIQVVEYQHLGQDQANESHHP